MAKVNNPRQAIRTHEGARAKRITPEQQLWRSVMSCMLWEKGFYEDGEEVATRIAETIKLVPADKVAAIAVEAREKMKLRHVPLLIVREMARLATHRHLVSATLQKVIQRADELSEFLAIYWKDERKPLSAQVKKGLAGAFSKFDEYALAKYNRDGTVKLRDVLFLSHAKPKDEVQAALWKRLVNNELQPPDTWEVALSAGQDKRGAWERLISEGKLGGLALLRNLRNMKEAGVSEQVIFAGIEKMKAERILPFRFIAAARYAPQWEDKIEPVMMRCLEGKAKVQGTTALLMDRSGSMNERISAKSDLTRYDAACGLAILARELTENVKIFSFGTDISQVVPRRGFALRDALGRANGGTYLGAAVNWMYQNEQFDRLIVLTDEQSQDGVPDPSGVAYMVNIASNKNGVGYGPWVHVDGWSESVLDYIRSFESLDSLS
ncbi:MAG TPA: TROVE domain-containing protein [Geobacter sp.]|nr:TROVE domain-containing protein [Geobacter sp.]